MEGREEKGNPGERKEKKRRKQGKLKESTVQ